MNVIDIYLTIFRYELLQLFGFGYKLPYQFNSKFYFTYLIESF
jgi:hypothetical protein